MPSRAALAALVSLQLVLCVASMRNDSATDDEPAHIAAGLMETRYGRMGLIDTQPPLMHALFVAPLLPLHVRLPPDAIGERQGWRLGKRVLFHSGNDAEEILFLARLPSLALFVCLTLFSYFWCWSLTRDVTASMTAATLVALCPILIAHGRVATADMGATAFSFAAVFCFVEWLWRPRLPFAVASGALIAAAILTKVSGLIVLPWMAVVFFGHALYNRERDWRKVFAQLGVIVSVAALSIYAFYLLELRPPFGSFLTAPFEAYAANVSALGRFYVAGHTKPQFLLGSFSARGWWYYFPVAFALKATIPALILIAAAAAFQLRFRRSLATRRDVHALGIAAFIVIFGMAALKSEIDLGVRYILPMIPFLYLGVALSVDRATHRFGRRALVPLAVLLLWHAGEAIATYPNYIGYFNECIGSNANADRYLIDSNLDWGQDLKRLAQWADAHHVERLRIDYFGGGDPGYYMPGKAIPWSAPRPERLPPGYFAVSRHFYRTSFFYRDYGMTYDQYLAGARKVATINGSIDVYRAGD
jgi:dolichyl-phosphate-mannose-protein mannosyltransferase